MDLESSETIVGTARDVTEAPSISVTMWIKGSHMETSIGEDMLPMSNIRQNYSLNYLKVAKKN